MHASPQVPTPAKPPGIDQMVYFDIAIWMVRFRNRYAIAGLPIGRYDRAIELMEHSRNGAAKARRMEKKPSVAGGPALRLAQAIWNYETRLLHPEDFKLARLEENCSSRLYYYHRDSAKRHHYRVWQAMEVFFALRGEPPVPASRKDDVYKPNPLRKALQHLDTYVQSHGSYVAQNPALLQVLEALANAHPDHEPLLLKVIAAARAYAEWLRRPQGVVEAKNLHLTREALHMARYNNAEFTREHEPRLNTAINKLLHDMTLS